MGIVASVYDTGTAVRVLLFSRKGRTFRFKGLGDELRPHSGMYVSRLHADMLQEKVSVLPVEDEGTREILLKKELHGRIGGGEDYLILSEEVLQESTERERVYRVFALPKEVLESSVPAELEEKLEFFTVPNFSIHGISSELFSDRTVFHAFADEKALIITVSAGGEVLYTRTTLIPAYAGADKEDYTDFVYENVSMTYMFVAQRSKIPVDLVLLSGKLYDLPRFVESLLTSIPVGIAVPLVPDRFPGMEAVFFLENLPSFGTLLLPQTYDFSPKELKEKRTIRRVLSKAIAVLSGAFLLSSTLLAFELFSLKKEIEDLKSLHAAMLVSLSAISKDIGRREEEIKYYATYINLIDKARRENPLRVLPATYTLLREIKPKRYVFSSKGGKPVLSVRMERTFLKGSDPYFYAANLRKKLEQLREKGISYRIEFENISGERKSLSMGILLEVSK